MGKIQLKIKNFYFLIFVFSFSFLLFNFSEANAASLYFFSSSGSHTVGGTFSVGVYVSSADQAMNAASGVISFPQDKLEVSSLSKTGSIFNLWVQEPLFSNGAGTINFEGIVLNPGFIGSAGKIITMNFRTKSTGSAYLSFSSGSVLANDGRGTNILTGMNAGNYNIQSTAITPSPESETEEITPPPTTGVPLAPKISSPTHPEPEKWYSNNNPEFTWKLPPDITGVRLLIDNKPGSIPTVTYVPPISERKLDDLADGIWYFHVQFQNQYGWGGVTHRKVLIDTEPPEPFQVIVDNKNDATNHSPVFLFETTDSLSGIEYYEVKIGEQKITVTPQNIKDNPYQLFSLALGKYGLEVRAYDKAGNYTPASTEFEILPIVESSPFLQFGKIVLDYLTTTITLIILIVGAIAVIFYTWYRISVWRKRVSKETKEVSQSVAGAFRALREEVKEQISMLDKKPGLTKEEKAIRGKLHGALDISEKFINKEIRDVEKELE